MNFWHRRKEGVSLAFWLLFIEPLSDIKYIIIDFLKDRVLDWSDREVRKKGLAGWGSTKGYRFYEWLDRL